MLSDKMLTTRFDKLPISNETTFDFLPFFVLLLTLRKPLPCDHTKPGSYKTTKLPVTQDQTNKQTTPEFSNFNSSRIPVFVSCKLQVNDKALLGLIICAWTLFA